MHAANARRNPPGPWTSPGVSDIAVWSRTDGGTEFGYFTDLARTAARSGGVAMHIDFSTSTSRAWPGGFFGDDSCAYEMAKGWGVPVTSGGGDARSKQIHGLTLGQRQLIAVAIAVEKARGGGDRMTPSVLCAGSHLLPAGAHLGQRRGTSARK